MTAADQPNMTLEEFFYDVANIQQRRRAAGVATVYFMHDTLSPHNVRAVWDDVPLSDVPGEGDVLHMPGCGYYGGDTWWRVIRQEWMPGAAVTIHVADAGTEVAE